MHRNTVFGPGSLIESACTKSPLEAHKCGVESVIVIAVKLFKERFSIDSTAIASVSSMPLARIVGPGTAMTFDFFVKQVL